MIQIQASVSKGWLHKYGGFTFTEQYYNDPLYRLKQDNEINLFVREKFPEYAIYNMESNLVQAKYVNKNHVLVGAIQPNMILATLLGASFSFFKDKDADVSGRPLENISSKEQLPDPESIPGHQMVKDLEDQIRNINEEHPELRVIPPFFWDESGRATIHGIATTSLKLTGESIMVLMMTDPELAHSIHQWIVEAYIILVNHFSKLGNLPVSSVHVGECAGTMLSDSLYEEFVVPYISQLGRRLGPVRLHSCGFSDHLITAISHIENLKIIDTGSRTSIAKIRETAGSGVEINVAVPFGILVKGAPREEILKWLDQTLEENNGGDLRIVYHMEPDYDIRNGLLIHDELERRGLIKNERLY